MLVSAFLVCTHPSLRGDDEEEDKSVSARGAPACAAMASDRGLELPWDAATVASPACARARR